ncbi:peptidase A24 [Staphylococcus lutrae]|uniref:Peptidase A24 n=3 Tax=Staphylococcus lutrae TaxID=155085 RepID=A0AAC9WK77_9STAP|nr:peptidase A24 [Staphylococcus lutrae]PNZ38931.1 peptidase A24 [Staphylococcus lutrae]
MSGSSLVRFLIQWAWQNRLKVSYLFERSKCQYCRKKLTVIDMLPIVSYCFFKGRCRFCQHAMPFTLFVNEIIGGLLILYPFLFPLYIPIKSFYFISFILLAVSTVDIQHQMIQHRFLLLLLILMLTHHHTIYLDLPHFSLWMILFIIGCMPQQWIGVGDIKLFLVLTFFFPFPFLLIFFELLFPIGCIVLPMFYCLKWVKNHRIPLAPVILITFLFISSTYPKIIVIYGGVL